MNQLFVLLPMLYLMGKIDFEEPMVLLACRAAFFVAAAATLAAHFFIKSKVQAKKDERTIWIPVKAPLQAEPARWERTTYMEHELAQVQKGLQGVYSSAGISCLLVRLRRAPVRALQRAPHARPPPPPAPAQHFYMGVNPPLLVRFLPRSPAAPPFAHPPAAPRRSCKPSCCPSASSSRPCSRCTCSAPTCRRRGRSG